ncbi:MAG: glutamate-5-semialdehyde dehydrogenase [Lentisphaeria bacterium]|nr:glutamate-5-semialdehyde dehydrogenase [Lentisphaeria bacterium]
MDLKERAALTKNAAIHLAALDTDTKNNALKAMVDALRARSTEIVEANHKDLLIAEAENLEAPLLKRLRFDEKKVAEVVAGIESLILLPEPVGKINSETELDNGLNLKQISCPIGVVGVIFESRPDALVQISSLCLKSGNGTLLKGGREALHTNRILTEIIVAATTSVGVPANWMELLETREDVNAMLALDESIDLIIPRGSNEFVQYIMANSNIPVLGHADGICHLYVDNEADIEQAIPIAVDSKCQYVAVCNALETMLVHEAIAVEFLPKYFEATRQYDLELRGCQKTQAIIDCKAATDEDWKTEYLDYILSIKVVDDMAEAINHINYYGSGHTEVILSTNPNHANTFMALCDSGNVMWNASTRFSDGFRYGLGAEVGISTNKIHARGPVGLEGLLIYKWKLVGHGHTVAPYANGEKEFTHKRIR